MKHNEHAGGVVTLEQPACPDCDGTGYVGVRGGSRRLARNVSADETNQLQSNFLDILQEKS